jgi:HK97 family phage prohead protease
MTATAPARAELAYGVATLARADTDGPITFAASTESLNAYNYSLRHEGWRLAAYQKNPIVAWNHDLSRPPIGRAHAELDRWTRQLRAAVTFDRGDPFAADIERRVRAGFLSAVSVGFAFENPDGTPIADFWRLSKNQIHDDAYYSLSEISVVPVPADPGAVKVDHSRAGGVTAHGAAALLAAASLDDGPVLIRRLVDQVLAERATRRAAVLASFPPVVHLAPILGSRP